MDKHDDITFREATRDDIFTIVSMLADDDLGATRERLSNPPDPAYIAAFEAIDQDPNHQLLLVEKDGAVAGVLQLIYTPHMTHIGSWRCSVEGVRVASTHRGLGLGQLMFEYAIKQARERGCRLIQLTSNKTRTDAYRFYERLGFEPSHTGFKLDLTK